MLRYASELEQAVVTLRVWEQDLENQVRADGIVPDLDDTIARMRATAPSARIEEHLDDHIARYPQVFHGTRFAERVPPTAEPSTFGTDGRDNLTGTDRLDPTRTDGLDVTTQDLSATPFDEPATETASPRPNQPQDEDQRLRNEAETLEAALFNALTWENTPAEAAGYDEAAPDVMVADVWATTPSLRLEQQLNDLIAANPDAFRGTRFALPAPEDPQPSAAGRGDTDRDDVDLSDASDLTASASDAVARVNTALGAGPSPTDPRSVAPPREAEQAPRPGHASDLASRPAKPPSPAPEPRTKGQGR